MNEPRGLRRGNWSVTELERLRQLLPRRGVEAMAALLRRSVASVQRKAAEMLRVPPRRGDWTASDEQLLRESFGALDLHLLSLALGRQPADVRRRAELLRTNLRTGVWTRAEEALLKDLYGTRSDADLEVSMSRSAADIAAAARRLCLAKDKRFAAHAEPDEVAPQRMPRWTAAEVAQLRAIYPDLPNLEVARQLGRTVTSVANKANLLGLKKGPRLLADLGRQNVGLRYGRGDADSPVSPPAPAQRGLGADGGGAAADVAGAK